MKQFSWKFRRMPDSDKAPDDDKLLPGYVILRGHFFMGSKEAGAVGKAPPGPAGMPADQLPLQPGGACQTPPATACGTLALVANPEFRLAPFCPVS